MCLSTSFQTDINLKELFPVCNSSASCITHCNLKFLNIPSHFDCSSLQSDHYRPVLSNRNKMQATCINFLLATLKSKKKQNKLILIKLCYFFQATFQVLNSYYVASG